MPPNSSYRQEPHNHTKARYAEVLARWPYDQRDRRKHIVVIGAGMAGLIASRCLLQAGHKVTIIEANNVPGGRVKTLRNQFTSDFYAEAGAMRVPDVHTLTLALIGSYLQPSDKMCFAHKSNNSLIFINNERRTLAQNTASHYHFHFALGPSERCRSSEDLFKTCLWNYARRDKDLRDFDRLSTHSPIDILSSLENEHDRLWSLKLFQTLDRFSLRRFLAEEAYLSKDKTKKGKLSQGARDFICALLVYDMHMPSSMAAIVGDYIELYAVDGYSQICGGMDRLPIAIASTLEDGDTKPDHGPGRFIYNARVIEIEQRPQRHPIVVTYENPVIVRHQEPVECDLAILAVPFSALRHVRMGPLMGARKRRAVRQLHYDNSCKILLEFNEKFWEIEDKIVGGRSITDLPIRQIHYPSKEQNPSGSGRGVLLASYTWGEDSLRWTALRHDDRIRFAIRQLERLHNVGGDALLKKCVGGMSHSWAEDEFTAGAFAMFEPYQLGELFEDIWIPEGRLHYCGEHTSLKHGWIEGAVESGLRVGMEVCERLDRDPALSAEDVKAPLPEEFLVP